MEQREIGNSGIKASAVGLGTFAIGGWFWGGTNEADSIKAIRKSLDMGVNLVDTAPIYGFGVAEQIVGKAIKGRRDSVVLATKVGLRWNTEKGQFDGYADDKSPRNEPSKYEIHRYLAPESITYEVEESLKRLGTDYIDLYQTHWQESTTPIDETMAALLKLKDQGKIRAIGVSNVSVEQIRKYGAVASAQEKFSLIDRGLEERGLLDHCVKNRISILSYFTLEQGLLTGKMSHDRSFAEGDTRRTNPMFSAQSIQSVNDSLMELEPYRAKYEVTLPQLVIALTFHQAGITHVLVGARNEKQAEENAAAGYIRLDPSEVSSMNKIFSALKKSMAQGK